MVERLSVNTDGVRSLAGIHDEVSSGLGSLSEGAPGAAAVAASHGTIAAAVNTALTGTLGSRTSSIDVTGASGARIAELLRQAAQAYERGDQRGAEAIKAAADAIARGESPAGGQRSAAAGGSGGPGSSSGGTEAIGQVLGQLGQLGQMSQMGQQLGAPLAALGQLPQQLLESIQSASQTTDSDEGSQGDEEARPLERRAEEGAAHDGRGGSAPVPPGEDRASASRPATD